MATAASLILAVFFSLTPSLTQAQTATTQSIGQEMAHDELLEGVASGGGFDGVDAFDEPVEARTNGGVGDAVDFRELLERAGGEQETFQE